MGIMRGKGFTYTENSFPKLSGWYGKVEGHDKVGCGGGAWYAVTIHGADVRGTPTTTPVVAGRRVCVSETIGRS